MSKKKPKPTTRIVGYLPKDKDGYIRIQTPGLTIEKILSLRTDLERVK